MLGITLPDAIALSTLIIAVLAAWRGAMKGDEARRVQPPNPALSVMGGLIESATMHDLIEAIRELSEALHGAAERRDHRASGRMAELLAEIRDRLDDRRR